MDPEWLFSPDANIIYKLFQNVQCSRLDMGNSSILSTDFCVCYISQANNKPGESLIASSRFVVLFPMLSAPYPAAHPNNADPRR